MTASLSVTDFTAYTGSWPYWKNRYASPEGLIELMTRWNIERAVVASTRSIFVDAAQGNEEVHSLSNEHPGRVIPFGSVNPLEGEVAVAELHRCAAELGMKGLGLYPAHHGYRLQANPKVDEVLQVATSLGMIVALPIRLIMNWGLPSVPVPEIEFIVRRFPGCTFVLGGVNYGEFQEAMNLLRSYENVCIETSCFQTLGGIELLVNSLGAERVLLGLGLPLQYPSPGLAKLLRAKLGEREKELVAGGNAQRLLGSWPNPVGQHRCV